MWWTKAQTKENENRIGFMGKDKKLASCSNRVLQN